MYILLQTDINIMLSMNAYLDGQARKDVTYTEQIKK